MRIDLHAHSTASDGTTPPADLMRAARECGLDVLALTDHDSTDGIAAAAAALPAGLTLVPGVEISCRGDGVSLHLLGYLADPADPALSAALRRVRESRVGRAEAMVAAMVADGVPISWPRVSELAGGTVGRPHIAQALVEAGVVADVGAAFQPDWIADGARYYVREEQVEARAAVRLVRAAGGVPVFAHPRASQRGRIVTDELIADMAAAGLAGMEVDHPEHGADDRVQLRGLAAELGLLVTGSSDFHGENKRVRLGEHTTDPATYQAILAQGSGAPPFS